MYSINNIPLANYGITPGQAPGSNIALSGHLDLPPRIGKTYHDWTGEPGVEPYVNEEEIFRGGRTLTFAGYMVGDGQAAAEGQLAAFYAAITAFEDLVPFETPWGTYEVYVKEQIESTYLQQGWIQFSLQLQEPVVAVVDEIFSEGTDQFPKIGSQSFSEMNMFITAFNGRLNRPQSKRQQFTAHGREGYQLTPVEALTHTLKIVCVAGDYAEMKRNVGDLDSLVARAGIHACYFDGIVRQCCNVDGMQVSRIIVAANYAACQIALPMLQPEPGPPLNEAFLADNQYRKMINEQEQYLTVYK